MISRFYWLLMFVLKNGEEIIPVVEAGEGLKLAEGRGRRVGMDRSAIKDSAGRGGEGGRVLAGEAEQLASDFSCGM